METGARWQESVRPIPVSQYPRQSVTWPRVVVWFLDGICPSESMKMEERRCWVRDSRGSMAQLGQHSSFGLPSASASIHHPGRSMSSFSSVGQGDARRNAPGFDCQWVPDCGGSLDRATFRGLAPASKLHVTTQWPITAPFSTHDSLDPRRLSFQKHAGHSF